MNLATLLGAFGVGIVLVYGVSFAVLWTAARSHSGIGAAEFGRSIGLRGIVLMPAFLVVLLSLVLLIPSQSTGELVRAAVEGEQP
jgi:hypothetical protein